MAGTDQASVVLLEQSLLGEAGLHVGNESAKRQISIAAVEQVRRVLSRGEASNLTFGAQLRMCCNMLGKRVVWAPSGTHILKLRVELVGSKHGISSLIRRIASRISRALPTTISARGVGAMPSEVRTKRGL